MTPRIKPFSISVDESELSDLRSRIRSTRWPDQVQGIGWDQGTNLDYLRQLLNYWANEFDWRKQERALNMFNHFHANLDGVNIHFIHAKARHGQGIPLILTHGWPSTFTEMLPLVPLLTDPSTYGIDSPSFDLVIPSLPGYGFSDRPKCTGVNYRYVAGLWHRLMRELGYDRYGAGGSDFGSGVATLMAIDDPSRMIGLYLSTLDISPYTGPSALPLSSQELAYLADNQRWADSERGYSAIQSTKPQTLGYALNDSPAGLAAWIIEKWRSWADSHGDPDARFSRDFLLTTITLYWVTQTITSSMRDYYDNRWTGVILGPNDKVKVPTGIALFDHEFIPEGTPPREWAERLYNVCRWTQMPSGGHFAAVEEPMLLARDIGAFFATLGRIRS